MIAARIPTERSSVRPSRQLVLAPPADTFDPAQMDLAALLCSCLAESERFYRGVQHDTRFAYELFRRAIVEGNDIAWEHIYTHYGPLVESWVRRSGAFASSGESSEYFVGAAFTKFWKAISERFEQFPTLASLLHYLQLCAGSVVIDSVRAQSWAEMLPEEALPPGHAPLTAPDEEAMKRVNCEEFWRYIDTQLHNEAERVVVFRSFVLGMKPYDIFNDRQDLFQSINDVYNVKRNVLGRLSRNTELRGMLAS
ncbi:MAG: sigma-70 family RNA polymerase sigma factor [Kouleothrix sp.]